jgi:large subunit ribosomal protein L10
VDRVAKEELVSELHDVFEENSTVVITHYSGMTVDDMTDLRGKMRDAGASFKVTKNRLTRLALAGTKFEGLTDMFVGPTAIACSEDPVAAAKVVAEYAKTNKKLILVGGCMDDKILDVEGVKVLASMPSLDELRGKLVGLLSAPATKIAGVLQAPAGQVARVISARSKQSEAA